MSLYNRYLYHKLTPSARSAAMGGVYSALQGPQMSFSGNPASLGFLEQAYVNIEGHVEDIVGSNTLAEGGTRLDAKQDADIWGIGVGVAYPFEWGAIAANYAYRDDENDTDEFRGQLTRYRITEEVERHMGSIAGGYLVNELVAVGYRYSYIDWDLDRRFIDTGAFVPATFALAEEDFQGHRNHAGVQYMFNECLVLGLDGMYGVGRRKIEGRKADADSWFVRGGMAYTWVDVLPLTVALDLKFEKFDLKGAGHRVQQDIFGVHLGAEYEVIDHIFLRAGYNLEDFDYEDRNNPIHVKQTLNGVTGGVGFEWNNINLDYSVMWHDTGASGDLLHFFGLGDRKSVV